MEESHRTRRTVCLKREMWIEDCIPSAERECVLEEINHWLADVPTRGLIELLPEIARKAEYEPRKEPVFEFDVPDDLDPEQAAIIVVEQPKKRPGTNSERRTESGQ